jgi:hypothetical protein
MCDEWQEIKMGQKSGNKKNEISFVNAARLMFEKTKIGKTDIHNNIYNRNHIIFSEGNDANNEKCEKRLYSHMGTYLLDDRYECIKRLIG